MIMLPLSVRAAGVPMSSVADFFSHHPDALHMVRVCVKDRSQMYVS
jgi:catalase